MKNTTMSLVALVASAMMGCSDKDDAIKAAESAGWSNVELTGSNYFNITCEKKEKAFHIVGENPAGKRTEATVCCGYTTPFKGCTIRYK